MRPRDLFLIFACLPIVCVSPLQAQQKGQWLPGQMGLNAGVTPDAGFTYSNMTINYSASKLNDSNGNALRGTSGTYAFWVDENVFSYVPKLKILGAKFVTLAILNYANGSLVADLPAVPGSSLSAIAGGSGLTDTFIQPVGLGWNLKRADFNVAYAFIIPNGRYTAGASNNVGSGYWGNFLTAGATLYLTKNKGTTANLFTGWEGHGQKSAPSIPSGQLSKITPGQAFTMEWGLGQVLPLKKDFSRLLQLGLVGYDQWQVSTNGGNYLVAGIPVAANGSPVS
jgi:hypothetical protein